MKLVLFGSFSILFFLLATPAFARAPTLDELPTVKKLQELADKAIDERRRAEVEASRDPTMDAIKAYREGSPSAPAWRRIADILKDEKETRAHREEAAKAFVERFTPPAAGDQRIEKAKREIATYLLKDLNSRERDVRIWVHGIFKTFWKNPAARMAFDPEEENYRKRYDAWKQWRDFLSGR